MRSDSTKKKVTFQLLYHATFISLAFAKANQSPISLNICCFQRWFMCQLIDFTPLPLLPCKREEEPLPLFRGTMKLFNHLRTLNTHHRILRNRFHPLFNNTNFFSDSSLPQQPTTPHVQQPSRPSSLNRNELAKFAAIAESWWDSDGPFKPLHVMNPTRLAFIRSALCRHFKKDPYSAKPLEGLKIADVGCGGGILSEPLARMGATVMGIDAVEKNINIARLHAESDPATSTIEFCCTTAEKLVEEGRKFDAVMALEVIEHVAEPAEFCKSLAALTIADGATIISTINRSMRAYATAIVAAEYILRWLPMGTHEWSSFLTPEELVLILQRAGINVEEMAGFTYNPITGRWSLSDDINVNFIAMGTKTNNTE